jgi:hypothetical protein
VFVVAFAHNKQQQQQLLPHLQHMLMACPVRCVASTKKVKPLAAAAWPASTHKVSCLLTSCLACAACSPQMQQTLRRTSPMIITAALLTPAGCMACVGPRTMLVLGMHHACPALQVRHLKRTSLILPEHYPSFTLLRQALGAVELGHEALSLLVPEVGTAAHGWDGTCTCMGLITFRVRQECGQFSWTREGGA